MCKQHLSSIVSNISSIVERPQHLAWEAIRRKGIAVAKQSKAYIPTHWGRACDTAILNTIIFIGFGGVEVMECVRCGAAAVVEGSLMDAGGGGGVAFLFKDISN